MAGHDHTHEEDNFYLDQLCMVAFSALFGGICLAMYFWKTTMLTNMLGPQFHPFVLASGITLMVLAVVRGAGLWVQVGQKKAHAHHEHTHAHEDHCHEHDGPCDHEPGHDHHHHDHSAEDHDHSWAPWRYVVLLVPVMLFLLGLPSKGKEVELSNAEFTKDSNAVLIQEAVSLVGPASLWSNLVYLGYLGKDQVNKEDALYYDFKKLEEDVRRAAKSSDPTVRAEWTGKALLVIGKFAPSRDSQREFRLVRHKITCCAPDAIPLELPILSRENITGIKADTWVKVVGRVEFRKRRDEYVGVIVVAGKGAVTECPPDPNPYVQ